MKFAQFQVGQKLEAGPFNVIEADVLETRTSSRGLGILLWRWQLFNQGGTQVLDLEATSLFKP